MSAPCRTFPPVSPDDTPPITALPRAAAVAPVAPSAVPMAVPSPGAMKLMAKGSTALKSFFRKNSGIPVIGLIVPAPPRMRRISASRGVMCASIVSPFRPIRARSVSPPRAIIICGGCMPISGGISGGIPISGGGIIPGCIAPPPSRRP